MGHIPGGVLWNTDSDDSNRYIVNGVTSDDNAVI